MRSAADRRRRTERGRAGRARSRRAGVPAVGWRPRPRPGPDRERGAAVVDFALVAGLLALVFAGVVQLTLAVHVRNTLVDCAAEGARYAALADRTPDDGVARTRALIDASLAAGYGDAVSRRRDRPARAARRRGPGDRAAARRRAARAGRDAHRHRSRAAGGAREAARRVGSARRRRAASRRRRRRRWPATPTRQRRRRVPRRVAAAPAAGAVPRARCSAGCRRRPSPPRGPRARPDGRSPRPRRSTAPRPAPSPPSGSPWTTRASPTSTPPRRSTSPARRRPCLTPGSDVSVRVAFDVPLPAVPAFVQGVVPLAVPGQRDPRRGRRRASG